MFSTYYMLGIFGLLCMGLSLKLVIGTWWIKQGKPHRKWGVALVASCGITVYFLCGLAKIIVEAVCKC